MRRIWFKPDCIKWIRDGKKTTTFRLKKHDGVYEIVKGSWFKPEKLGIRVKLTPLCHATLADVIDFRFDTEGDFHNSDEFLDWLKDVGLWKKYPHLASGWLHKIEVLEGGA